MPKASSTPKMKSTLESRGLPPKLLSLTTGKQTEEVQLQLESTELHGRIDQVIARVGNAKFSSPDDAQVVPTLYKDFVEKITRWGPKSTPRPWPKNTKKHISHISV